MPDVVGRYGQDGNTPSPAGVTWGPQGAFYEDTPTTGGTIALYAAYKLGNTHYMGFSAARCNSIFGRSDTIMPASVNIPVVLYLGLSA